MSALLDRLAPESARSDASWLAAARIRARKELMRHGFPTLKTEDWKYTSLRALEKSTLASAAPTQRAPANAGLATEATPAGTVLRWHDGALRAAAQLPAGIELTPFSALDAQRGPALLRDNFGGSAGAFAWLNTTQFEEGWLVEINTSQAQPVCLEFQSVADAVGHPRIVFRLAADTTAQIIERHPAAGGLLNIVMDTLLAAGAQLDWVRVQQTTAETFIVQRHDVRLERDARLGWTTLDTGGRLVRHDLNIDLAEPGSACHVNGAFAAHGHSHIDHHTQITHSAGHTLSRENFRGILAGHGHGVFNGKIIMVPGADGSDSRLNSANLLLSANARIDTKPELEIHAEEVKAAHGATVGALDENALFYLQSRGIPREQATMLLKEAFLKEIIEQVSPHTLQTELHECLARVISQ